MFASSKVAVFALEVARAYPVDCFQVADGVSNDLVPVEKLAGRLAF